MGNVIKLNCNTKLDIEPEIVLKHALDSNLTEVAVMGYDQDGEIFLASSTGDIGRILVLVERLKLRILSGE
jgi:hypothetical protein